MKKKHHIAHVHFILLHHSRTLLGGRTALVSSNANGLPPSNSNVDEIEKCRDGLWGTTDYIAGSLYTLIKDRRLDKRSEAIPLYGVHDALSAKIFSRHGAPALFLSGFGVSASLLGLPDVGMTNLVEMEMVTRNIYSVLSEQTPLIVDGDTGFGGPPNILRTVSSLAAAGAAAVTIEDQNFPKVCTIAAGSNVRIVDRETAVQRVRCALAARDEVNMRSDNGPWIVARTDCRMAFGFDECVERCLQFEQLGAQVIYAENLQSVEEYERLRRRLDPLTVTIVAQVQENRDPSNKTSKPLLTTGEVGDMGYDLALFGVTPLQIVAGALESAALELLDRGGENGLARDVAFADFATVKEVVSFDKLEQFSEDFPCT